MKRIAAQISALLTLCLVAAVAAAAQAQVTPVKNPAYRIGPRDLLDIKVFEVPELNVQRRVSEDGAVNLPLIGDVSVSSQTPAEVAAALKRLLEAKYVQRASVDVQVQEFRSRPISVIGAVKQPGNLAFSGRWTLLEALTNAGGLAEGHGNMLYVLRRSDNGLSDQLAIDLDDLLVRADPRANIPLLANDLINVPSAVDVTVYCLGEVAHPGAVSFKSTERITLVAAIARAGGLTDRAARKILVRRAAATAGGAGGAGATPGDLQVDWKRLLDGKAPDVELHQGDVVVVKESFF
jgi:polysaccharide biosynthesis/export protein